MWGFCVSKNCSRSSFKVFSQFLNTSAHFLGMHPQYIEYLFPYDDLLTLRSGILIGYIIMVSILVTSTILGFVGVIVEYTKFGSKQLSHEETNFNNIDIPLIQEGNTQDQLKQIMMIKDELLRNSKKLWASILLCFSYTRNLRLLFFRYKIQPQRLQHRNVMYLVSCVGLVWYMLFTSTFLAINTFPQNYMQIGDELAQTAYILYHGGQLFGSNMIYLAAAYRIVTNLLEYQNFRPTIKKQRP